MSGPKGASAVETLPHLHLPGRRAAGACVAAGLLAGGFLLRWLLDPLIGSQQPYTAFYPAVMMAAYLQGWRSASLVAALSGLLAQAVFVHPDLRFRLEPAGLAPLLLFGANSAVSIAIITGMTGALSQIRRDQQKAQMAAQQHAELFTELNARVGEHLQLVASVLRAQADGEPDGRIGQALAKASESSRLLAAVHRQIGGRDDTPVPFLTFAEMVLGASLDRLGRPRDLVQVNGENMLLGAEAATSLAVALLECTGPFVAAGEQVVVSVVGFGGPVQGLRIKPVQSGEPDDFLTIADSHLFNGVLAQVRASAAVVGDAGTPVLEIRLDDRRRSQPWDASRSLAIH